MIFKDYGGPSDENRKSRDSFPILAVERNFDEKDNRKLGLASKRLSFFLLFLNSQVEHTGTNQRSFFSIDRLQSVLVAITYWLAVSTLLQRSLAVYTRISPFSSGTVLYEMSTRCSRANK